MSGSDNDSRQSESESAELLTDELFQCCNCYLGLSEEFLREIIERHELTLNHNNHHRVNNYQFFRIACYNEKITEGIIRFLLDYFPEAANDAADDGKLPLHYACDCLDVPLGVIQLLIDAAPDSVRSKDDGGNMPLHCLCNNSDLDEVRALEILKLLLKKCPESIRHAETETFLPIHIAAIRAKSPEFLSVMIEAYPGSERIAHHTGMLPIHFACRQKNSCTVEYLYKLYPDAIHHTTSGMYPIHVAAACTNVDVVKFLLDCDPSVKLQKFEDMSLLLWACCLMLRYNDTNIAAGLEIIELICDADPQFIREETFEGDLLIHRFCCHRECDGITACEFLNLLLKMYPESIRHANIRGQLPIHSAAMVSKSPEFCSVLIEAYPGSERIAGPLGMLPIHCACMSKTATNTVATVEYLYNLYPDGINYAAVGVNLDGHGQEPYPIHITISSLVGVNRVDPEAAVDIVQFLLGSDERVKLQRFSQSQGLLSLSTFAYAYLQDYNDANIGAALKIIKAIYDAHPQAIESYDVASHMHRCHPQVQTFVTEELVYSRLSKQRHLMTTPDGSGQLPLHVAVQNNARLGSIKLLVKKYPSAVRSPDNSGALPLHLACMHHESASVVQYLIEFDTTTLEALGEENNTALHYACRSAKYETIALLLGKYEAISVSKRNAQEKIPLDLLWESNEVVDRESVEYMGSVFQLVKAHPETVMSWV